MKHRAPALLLAMAWLALDVGAREQATMLALSVEKLEPQPNYDPSAGAGDERQLTDGQIVAYPMWSNPLAVTWSEKRSVRIFIRSTGRTGGLQAHAGTLRLHTARKPSVGILVPARVDVYSQMHDGRYIHTAGRQFAQEEFKANDHHWIDIDVKDLAASFVIVVHAQGQFITLDEIEFRDVRAGSVVAAASSAIPGSALAGDSMKRLSAGYQEMADSPVFDATALRTAFGTDRLVAWAESPWSEALTRPDLNAIQINRSAAVSVAGAHDEIESALFGLLHTGSSNRTVRVTTGKGTAPGDAVQAATLKRVVAGNGATVYDAIGPLAADETVIVEPGKPTYVWLSIDLDQLPTGHSSIPIVFRDAAAAQTLETALQVDVFDARIADQTVRANAWAFDDDLPIWRFADSTIEDLRSHGVNVFVIHHRHIPRPSLDGSWDGKKWLELRNRIARYRGKGLTLLYMEWESDLLEEQGVAWLRARTERDVAQRRTAMEHWLRELSTALEGIDITNDDWALYIVDEIQRRHMDFFLDIARVIKDVAPRVRIYANPINTSMSPTGSRDLEAMRQLVDYWQPELNFAMQDGRSFFQSLKTPWWIYANPERPAKAGAPLGHYRLLSWRAWSLGARGVGFWSYSDTWGTTAWDDFDGPRTDWAVVYENRKGNVSSRRWEAFREGVEDMKLFMTADNVLSGDRRGILNAIRIRVLDADGTLADQEAIEQARRSVLEALPGQAQ